MSSLLTSERGCGTRTKGGIYAECPLGKYGEPLEYFLIDAPRVMDFAALGVPKRGVKQVEQVCDTCAGSGVIFFTPGDSALSAVRDGRFSPAGTIGDAGHTKEGECPMCIKGTVAHFYDWIGEGSYPTVADYLEEVRALGMSRKLSPGLDFSKLTRGSRIFQIHARGSVRNYDKLEAAERAYLEVEERRVKRCPKSLPNHEIGALIPADRHEYCARFHWQLLEGDAPEESEEDSGEETENENPRNSRELEQLDANNERLVARTLPCRYHYSGLRTPSGFKPEYVPAVIAWFPITRLAVIKDAEGKSHEKALARLANANVPVEVQEA